MKKNTSKLLSFAFLLVISGCLENPRPDEHFPVLYPDSDNFNSRKNYLKLNYNIFETNFGTNSSFAYFSLLNKNINNVDSATIIIRFSDENIPNQGPFTYPVILANKFSEIEARVQILSGGDTKTTQYFKWKNFVLGQHVFTDLLQISGSGNSLSHPLAGRYIGSYSHTSNQFFYKGDADGIINAAGYFSFQLDHQAPTRIGVISSDSLVDDHTNYKNISLQPRMDSSALWTRHKVIKDSSGITLLLFQETKVDMDTVILKLKSKLPDTVINIE